MKKYITMLVALAMLAMAFAGCAEPAAKEEVAGETTAAAATEEATEATTEEQAAEETNLEMSLALDASSLVGSDGQKLLIYGEAREVSEKPADEEGALMWEIEYAGRLTEKEPMIPSPADGIIGKKIIMIAQSGPLSATASRPPASSISATTKSGIRTEISISRTSMLTRPSQRARTWCCLQLWISRPAYSSLKSFMKPVSRPSRST